jgi:hypothetical protein
MFCLEGGEWVAREIVQHVWAGRAKFVINSGDVVWWGNQGLSIKDSPYWKRLNDSMLKLLPDADAEMRAAGLDGRWFLSRELASSAVTTMVPFCDRTRWICDCL